MDPKVIMLLVFCIAAITAAGCTAQSPGPVGTTAVPSPFPTTPATTAPPVTVAECTSYADCVPAECCHPSSCIPAAQKQPCNLMCTASCTGPLDCGAGSCGCVNGKCSVVPALPASSDPSGSTGITIRASPQRYSPIMSSTPGIGLEPVATGFGADNTSFTWKATYGHFLSWNPPDFRVNQMGDSITNHGEKIYWSFTDRTSSTSVPVTISVTATETGTGNILGSSAVTLSWEGNYTVTVPGTG